MRLYLSSFRLGNDTKTLLKLLGGRTRAAVITNADDYKTGSDRLASFERERGDLGSLCLAPVELDLRNFFGKGQQLRRHLERSDLVWVRGGNPFILRRAMRASGADTAILDLLAADEIVYGGYSAGSCMMTPSLRGIELVDDPNDVPEGYDPEVIWDALGILPYHLLPHFRSDHPESPLIDKSLEYMIGHHLPFIALRDGQALVRDGADEFVAG
ncbi:MAG: Type 1 glutamine amidotransferase-like domain-containing protein [Streptosporangiaceae bacterium]